MPYQRTGKSSFQYYQWNVKEMELRHDGAWYHIQSMGTFWDDENYYLVGYDSEAELIKHYRVDKMLHIRMSTEAREGKEHFKQLDMADYARKVSECSVEKKDVKLLVDNRLVRLSLIDSEKTLCSYQQTKIISP